MNHLRAAGAFTAVVLRGLSRDRSALVFMLVLPVAIIVIIGSTFGGEVRLDLGFVRAPDAERGGSSVSERLEAAFEAADGVRLRIVDDEDELAREVRRFTVAAGVVVPAAADDAVHRGEPAAIRLLTMQTSEAAVTARQVVTGIVDEVAGPLAAARFAASQTGTDPEAALVVADELVAAGAGGGLSVVTVDVGEAAASELSRFSLTAPQNLVLFTFITSLTSATLAVRARRARILHRAMAAPAGLPILLTGMAAGWFVLAMIQSALIVVVGAVAFGVNWGHPLGAAALLVTFAAVGCGAGLLVGALGDNEDRVGSIAPIAGIVAGALGGCMVPLEVFPPIMRAASRAVPHSWAVDGWQRLIFDGVGPGGIAGNLAVLGGFAVALLGSAVLLLRRSLVSGR